MQFIASSNRNQTRCFTNQFMTSIPEPAFETSLHQVEDGGAFCKAPMPSAAAPVHEIEPGKLAKQACPRILAQEAGKSRLKGHSSAPDRPSSSWALAHAAIENEDKSRLVPQWVHIS
jgi:hypothetical protein